MTRSSGRFRVVVAVLAAVWLVAGLLGSPAVAEDKRQERDSIFITKNSEFNPANGVRAGSGTRGDPFVISGWRVDDIFIKDTSTWVVIKDNEVNRMVLDWIGPHVLVKNNAIGDLRVNQNVERTGDATGGRIVRNTFRVVGQLRHFDGEFAHNTVGSSQMVTLPFTDRRAVNFDGFNGGHFHDNTLYGYLEARLHGHHHSSGFDRVSHSHVEEHADHQHHDHEMANPHAHRYHRVLIEDNKIYSSGRHALIYTDTNHAANDRTAASERDERLNAPHVHHTKVFIRDNTLYDGSLYVDVFNAEDERHRRIGLGSVTLKNNRVIFDHGDNGLTHDHYDAIEVYRAQGIYLRIIGNKVSDTPVAVEDSLWWGDIAGIRLHEFDEGHIFIVNNETSGFQYGVWASQFTKSVHWWIGGLVARGAETDVYYDNSVPNHPHRRP